MMRDPRRPAHAVRERQPAQQPAPEKKSAHAAAGASRKSDSRCVWAACPITMRSYSPLAWISKQGPLHRRCSRDFCHEAQGLGSSSCRGDLSRMRYGRLLVGAALPKDELVPTTCFVSSIAAQSLAPRLRRPAAFQHLRRRPAPRLVLREPSSPSCGSRSPAGAGSMVSTSHLAAELPRWRRAGGPAAATDVFADGRPNPQKTDDLLGPRTTASKA